MDTAQTRELKGAGERDRAADLRDWQGGCWGPKICQKLGAGGRERQGVARAIWRQREEDLKSTIFFGCCF